MLSVCLNNKKTYVCPERWDELSGAQLISIAPYVLKADVPAADRAAIAYYLCGFGDDIFSVKAHRQKDGYDYFANELIDRVIPRLSFLFEKNELTKQLLPEIEVGKKYRFFGTQKLYGPASNFDNLTIGEFSDTETCLKNFDSTGDELWMNRFIAVLYRPRKRIVEPHHPDYDGDIRQPYNFHLNDFISVMVSRLDVRVKCAVRLWYLGCRAALVEQNPFMFSKKTADKANEGSWAEVIHGLAGPKFGSFEQTGRANLKVVMKELHLLHERQKELEEMTR